MSKQVKLKVPESMSEVSLRRYQRFIEELNGKEYTEDYVAEKILEIFCDVPAELVRNIKVEDIFRVSSQINEVLQEKPSLITKFRMGDTTFGFIPKLDEMTFGEYVDLDTYISDWSQMHRAMAVLYRPITKSKGDKYQIADYDAEMFPDAMKSMPLSVAISAMLFFYNLEIDLLEITADSLRGEYLREARATSILSGGGINQYMLSPKET